MNEVLKISSADAMELHRSGPSSRKPTAKSALIDSFQLPYLVFEFTVKHTWGHDFQPMTEHNGVTGEGLFFSQYWTPLMSNLCSQIPIDLVETFSELQCSLRLFIPHLPPFLLSFHRCKTDLIVWRFFSFPPAYTSLCPSGVPVKRFISPINLLYI